MIEPKHQVTLVMDDRQARVVQGALDLYSRVGMGQLEELYHMVRMRRYMDVPESDWAQVEKAFHLIKRLVWGHPPNGSWGIFNKDVPLAAREAYDIQQVLRKALAEAAWVDEPGSFRGADFNSYLPTHPEWPPVQVTVVSPPSEAPLPEPVALPKQA